METLIAAMIAGFVTLLSTQLVLHSANRKAAKDKAAEELTRDNQLAFLLKEFPPHKHRDHQGIDYPSGMHPGGR